MHSEPHERATEKHEISYSRVNLSYKGMSLHKEKILCGHFLVGYVLAMSLLAQICLKSQIRGRCLGIGLQSPRCKRTYCSLLQQY